MQAQVEGDLGVVGLDWLPSVPGLGDTVVLGFPILVVLVESA